MTPEVSAILIAVMDQKVKNPKRAGSLAKDKPISLGIKTLKWGKQDVYIFFVNDMRGDVVKVMSFQVREKTLEGGKSQESCVLAVV